MNLFLKVMFIISSIPAIADELYNLKTGDYLVVKSCLVASGKIKVKLCGEEVECPSYNPRNFACNHDNGTCAENWAQSTYELGWLPLSKDELKDYKNFVILKSEHYVAAKSQAFGSATGLASGSATGLASGSATGLASGSATGLASGSTTDLASGSATGLASGSTTDLASGSTTDVASGSDSKKFDKIISDVTKKCPFTD